MGTGKLIHHHQQYVFWGAQAFLLPWFAKVVFLYPPPLPHGRQFSQNGRAIRADVMIR